MILDSTPGLDAADKAKMMVLPVGSNDMFGPESSNADHWRERPEEENWRQMAKVVREVGREQRAAESKRTSSTSASGDRFKSPASGRRSTFSQKSPLLAVDQSQRRFTTGSSYDRRPGSSPAKSRGTPGKKSSASPATTRREDRRPPKTNVRRDRGKSAGRGKGRGRGKP